MLRPFLVLLLGLATVSSTITHWTKIGETMAMACPMPDEGEEIQVCSWRNGGEGAFKSSFKKSHGDRISIEKIKNDTLCTLLFETVEEEDEGTWGCQIRYENKDGESIEAEAKRILNVANFSAENPILDEVIVDENTTETNFICKFESKPLPTFSWYIDDEKLADSTELSEDKMSQTLKYGQPREGHSNKTLKCVVDFKEYGLKDTFQESLEFDFPENVVLVPKKPEPEPEEKPQGWLSNETNPIRTIIILIICVLMVIAFVVAVILRSCNPCGPNWGPCYVKATKSDDTDAETGTSDSLPMKESTDTEKTDDNETEKADSTKDEKEKIPEVVNRNFGDRLASFFRINKSFNMEDEKLDDEKETDESEEVPEVVVDGTGDKKEVNGELDKSGCNGHNKTDETVALGAKKANGGSRIMALFGKMFKPLSDVVADTSATEDQTVVKMVEEGLEQTVVEETTPLAKEVELEDKSEPVEEDNKKEPTPNTSF